MMCPPKGPLKALHPLQSPTPHQLQIQLQQQWPRLPVHPFTRRLLLLQRWPRPLSLRGNFQNHGQCHHRLPLGVPSPFLCLLVQQHPIRACTCHQLQSWPLRRRRRRPSMQHTGQSHGTMLPSTRTTLAQSDELREPIRPTPGRQIQHSDQSQGHQMRLHRLLPCFLRFLLWAHRCNIISPQVGRRHPPFRQGMHRPPIQ